VEDLSLDGHAITGWSSSTLSLSSSPAGEAPRHTALRRGFMDFAHTRQHTCLRALRSTLSLSDDSSAQPIPSNTFYQAIRTYTVSKNRTTTIYMTLIHNVYYLLSRRSRQRERLSASMLSICSSVCLFVCLLPKYKKTRFSQKSSNLELWCLLTTYRKSYFGFSKNPLLDG